MICAKIRMHNIFLERVLLQWRRAGVFLKWIKGCKICVLEDVLWLWRRGCPCSERVQNLCLGGGTFAMEERFLFWRGCFKK